MLLSLRIENFALIDHLELEFGHGLNVLTGETGAGKSIILDALDAALGGKLTSRAVRTGANRSLVEATFELKPDVAQWLRNQEIELLEETLVVASRELVLSVGGVRSRSRLNGVLVNRQLMDQLRDRLVEITAQGQTSGLGKAALQRDWLDLYGGQIILQQRQTVAAAFAAWTSARLALEKRRQSEQQRLQRLDLLTYQSQELSTANLTDIDELEQLEQERNRLSHVVDLQKESYQVYANLYEQENGDRAAADLIGQAEATLSDMVIYDSQLQPILEMVRDALAQVTQAGRQLASYGASLEADPERLSEVDERIRELKQICRKYGPTLTEAIAYRDRIQVELTELWSDGQSLDTLEQAEQICTAQLIAASEKLTKLRCASANQLESHLIAELKPLAMAKVQFQVDIMPCTPTAAGADQITFSFSPNPGEPMQPLGAIASGGEMSRFLLALKACFSQVDQVPTLVFDEIDVGVSGKVAQTIAQKLYQLSDHHQVLCVTHQPIVAAMADCHFRVNKQVIEPSQIGTENFLPVSGPNDLRTVVRVVTLDHQQRRVELAQLASGQSDLEAIAFAESLLTQAEHLRQKPNSHLA